MGQCDPTMSNSAAEPADPTPRSCDSTASPLAICRLFNQQVEHAIPAWLECLPLS